MIDPKIYLLDGSLYHEDCIDSQDINDAILTTDVDGNDECEECGKPLVNEDEG